MAMIYQVRVKNDMFGSIDGVPVGKLPREFDLNQNDKTFDQAFAEARDRKVRTFMWRGKQYSTRLSGESESKWQSYTDFIRDGLTFQERAEKQFQRRNKELARIALEKEKAEGWEVYLAGSLRNDAIPVIAQTLEQGLDSERVFSDWYAAGPEADDHWKAYYTDMGYSYREALKEPASINTFEFDRRNMLASKTMVLALPAGKSGHMELGWFLGKGKPGYILLDSAEDRWDVMYQFATGVTDDIEELIDWIRKDLA